MVNIEIITIGDELLIGQVIDTNSAWMAQQLNMSGFDVKYKTTVGDDETDIIDAFDKAFSRVTVVLVTGGIGPTKDDITKKTLCKYFDTELVFDHEVLQNIEEIFQHTGRALNELTRNQAYVPKKSTVIQNKMGTAPVTWFENNGKILVSMPGVPYEMKWVMSEEVIPRLRSVFRQHDVIEHITFWVSNFTESALAMELKTFEDELPDNLKLAYLPTPGLIRLRITGRHTEQNLLDIQTEEQRKKLHLILKNNIIAEEDKPVQILLAELLKEKGLTLGVAESCTGGNIAHLITSIPGSSSYFKGGIVSYSNEVKMNLLNVSSYDLDNYGAVSEPVVQQMARGAKDVLETDCSISTSGIAGPDGGTDEKPVGTVWIAVSYGKQLVSTKYIFSKNRENNILRASNMALLMLYQLIKTESK